MKEQRPFFAIRWYRVSRDFIRDAMAELKRVVWPEWEEVRNYTYLVILVMFIVGAWMAAIYVVLDVVATSRLVQLYG